MRVVAILRERFAIVDIYLDHLQQLERVHHR
jgi:hypothetical protein